MTRESLDIILRLWNSPGPFRYQGKFWKVEKPAEMFGVLRPHIKPFQSPHPPIGVAARQRACRHIEPAEAYNNGWLDLHHGAGIQAGRPRCRVDEMRARMLPGP